MNQEFVFKEAYLNSFLKGKVKAEIISNYLNVENMGGVYEIRSLNFEERFERKEELAKIYYRLHELSI